MEGTTGAGLPLCQKVKWMEAARSTLGAYHMARAGIFQGGSIQEPEEPRSDRSVWLSQVGHLGWWLGGRTQVWLSSRDRG